MTPVASLTKLDARAPPNLMNVIKKSYKLTQITDRVLPFEISWA